MKAWYTVDDLTFKGCNFVLVENFKNINLVLHTGLISLDQVKLIKTKNAVGFWKIKKK